MRSIRRTTALPTGIVNGVLEDVSDKASLSCFYVAWESYQYENILSLVVSCGWDADVNEYNVYLYDIVSGSSSPHRIC